MKYLTTVLCLFASPVLAQITPAELLDSWQQFSSRTDAGFTFVRQEGNGDEIMLYEVTLGGGVPAVLPWLKLTAAEGGTVDISTVESLRWEAPVLEDIPDYIGDGHILLEGLSIRASGTPNDVQYGFAIDHYTSNSMTGFRETTEHTMLGLRGLAGTLEHRWGNNVADVLALKLSAAFFESASDASIRGESAEQQSGSAADFAIEAVLDFSRPKAGPFAFTSGEITHNMNVGGGFVSEISARSTALSGSDDLNTPFVRAELTGVSVTQISQGRTPPDLNLRFDTFLLNAEVTNRREGTSYPWQIEARLEGLVLSKGAWAMIDPTAALPQDPSHFIAKLSGTGERLSESLEGNPFLWLQEMRSLALETLDLRFGGLSLLASGDVSFQGDAGSIYGPPNSDGGLIRLRMQGAQSLLKALDAGPASYPILGNLLRTTAPAGQSPDDLDVQILFDEAGGVSVE